MGLAEGSGVKDPPPDRGVIYSRRPFEARFTRNSSELSVTRPPPDRGGQLLHILLRGPIRCVELHRVDLAECAHRGGPNRAPPCSRVPVSSETSVTHDAGEGDDGAGDADGDDGHGGGHGDTLRGQYGVSGI